jgi:hypothetical protein
MSRDSAQGEGSGEQRLRRNNNRERTFYIPLV